MARVLYQAKTQAAPASAGLGIWSLPGSGRARLFMSRCADPRRGCPWRSGCRGSKGGGSVCWEAASAVNVRDEELSPRQMPGSRLADRTVSVTVVRFESVHLHYLPARS